MSPTVSVSVCNTVLREILKASVPVAFVLLVEILKAVLRRNGMSCINYWCRVTLSRTLRMQWTILCFLFHQILSWSHVDVSNFVTYQDGRRYFTYSKISSLYLIHSLPRSSRLLLYSGWGPVPDLHQCFWSGSVSRRQNYDNI